MTTPTTIINNGVTYKLSNLGPLTTVFTPAAPCLSTWWLSSGVLRLGPQSPVNCFPPGFETTAKQAYYFSPGVCPASYTIDRTLSSTWLGRGETGVKCCPSGFTIEPNGFLNCTKSPVSVPVTIDKSTVTVVTGIWAPAIAVIWKSADLTSMPRKPVVFPHDDLEDPPLDNLHTSTIAIATVIPILLIAFAILVFVVYRGRATRAPIITVTPAVELSIKTTNLPALDITPVTRSVTPTPSSSSAVPSPITREEDEIQWLQHEQECIDKHQEHLLKQKAMEDHNRVVERRSGK